MRVCVCVLYNLDSCTFVSFSSFSRKFLLPRCSSWVGNDYETRIIIASCVDLPVERANPIMNTLLGAGFRLHSFLLLSSSTPSYPPYLTPVP